MKRDTKTKRETFFEEYLKKKQGKKKNALSRMKINSAKKYMIDTDQFCEEILSEDHTFYVADDIQYNGLGLVWFEFFFGKENKFSYFNLNDQNIYGILYDAKEDSFFCLYELFDEDFFGFPGKEIKISREDLEVYSSLKDVSEEDNETIEYNLKDIFEDVYTFISTKETVFKHIKEFAGLKRSNRGNPKKVFSHYTMVYREKNPYPERPSTGKNPLEYRHPVRGHWRKVKGYGKNYLGEKVFGKTWVKEHIRGDESLPFRNKPKIVVNS